MRKNFYEKIIKKTEKAQKKEIQLEIQEIKECIENAASSGYQEIVYIVKLTPEIKDYLAELESQGFEVLFRTSGHRIERGTEIDINNVVISWGG